MADFFSDKMILSLIVLICVFWVGLILYRVGRGELIQKVDFWKSKWKIVLFWFIVAAIAILVLYVLDKFGLLDKK